MHSQEIINEARVLWMINVNAARCIVRLGIALPLAAALLGFTSAANAEAPLSPAPAANARVVRLEHADRREDRSQLVVTALSPTGGQHVDIYFADHDGAPFRKGGEIHDPEFASGLCCGTQYELPQQVGSLKKGSLLWAGSVGQRSEDRRMRIKIYCSDDEGRSWRYLNEILSPNAGGLWEPEFTVDREGALVLFFSDETESGSYSQTLKKVRSYDGLTWRDMSYVVASRIQRDRPGMAVTQRLRDGHWMMTYELCGPARCSVHFRLSNDGWNWGDPSIVGSPIRLPNGSFPAHAARFTVMPDGSILLAGQLIERPDGAVAPRNGLILLVNKAGNPATSWGATPAPVPVPDACSEACHAQQWCPNYSSALLPSQDGTQVLEFASRWTGRGCYTVYGWTSPRTPPADGGRL